MDQSKHYLIVISHKLQALTQQIEELSHLDFPSNSPLVLAEILHRILLRLFAELMDLYNKVDNSLPQDILDKARIINYSVLLLGKITESIQGAQIKPNSSPMSSIIEAFESICGRVALTTKVIIYPQWIYNASFLDAIPNLRELAKNINNGNSEDIFKGEPVSS